MAAAQQFNEASQTEIKAALKWEADLLRESESKAVTDGDTAKINALKTPDKVTGLTVLATVEKLLKLSPQGQKKLRAAAKSGDAKAAALLQTEQDSYIIYETSKHFNDASQTETSAQGELGDQVAARDFDPTGMLTRGPRR